MKVALVSQPVDVILPPRQNSVGACTFGTALSLAKAKGATDVIVYGRKIYNQPEKLEFAQFGVRFKFFEASLTDRSLFKMRKKGSDFFQIWSPISTSGLFFPDYAHQVARHLQQESCDVIHVQHCSQFVPVIRKYNPNAKIVLHLHAEWFSQSDPTTLRARLRDVDLLTTVSDYITEKTKRQFPEFASIGVDEDEFAGTKDYGALRTRPRKQLLYAGGISPHKGLHVLLEAFKGVVAEYPEVQLLVSGPEGNYPFEENFDKRDTEAIRDLARFYPKKTLPSLLPRRKAEPSRSCENYGAFLRSQLDEKSRANVTFLGSIPRQKLVDLYHESDIFVFPPVWNEGFGLPPVEAMAAGTAVIASRSGAIVETVRDGETGFLVNCNDAKDLASRILELLADDDKREAMGRAGKQRALECFTWDKVATDLDRRYRQLCGDQPTVEPVRKLTQVVQA
jgi:glycosyltransferase involved in cell wall biosynthesis